MQLHELLTVLLTIGARELKDENGDDEALTLATSRANLLARNVEVLAVLEVVEGLMMKVNAVRASTVGKTLTLAMRAASIRKYSASCCSMAKVSPSSARNAVCEVDKRAPATYTDAFLAPKSATLKLHVTGDMM